MMILKAESQMMGIKRIYIYTERVGEEAQTDFDEESGVISFQETKDGDEVVVMEYEATEGDFEKSQGSGNYTSASFALIQCDNASLYPQSDLEMEFDRKGIGGNSIC